MKRGKLNALRITLFTAAAAMIIIGIFWGEALEVFRKAAVICLECIGIG
jgi:hypothetical protein